jgi:hypothetical protein
MTSNALHLSPSGDYASTSVLLTEDGHGVAADLTGYVASIVDVTGVLGLAVTADVVDAAAGEVRIAIAWQGAWPLTAGQLGTFRLALVNGEDEAVSAPAAVRVQGPALQLVINRGSDLSYGFTWPDDREGVDLTGETLDVVNASDALAPLVNVAVTDAATRACRLSIEGDLSVAVGAAGTFQLERRISGAQPRTLPPIAVTFR